MAELERFADRADDQEPEGADTDAQDSDTTDEPDDDRRPLLDPASLPDELRPHWSRMSRAYNQRLQRLRDREADMDDLERRASVVDQFNQNPYGALQQLAGQYGYQLTPQGNNGGQQSGSNPNVPDSVQQRVRQAFRNSPDLAFLSPQIAEAVWTVAQDLVGPMQQQQQQQSTAARQQEHNEAVEILDEIAPNWYDHENEMSGLLTFLRGAFSGGTLRHPRYGHIYEMLYRVVTGDAAATATASRRLANAARNATTSGRQRAAPVDIQQHIGNAKSMQDKLAVAFRAAMQEHGVDSI